MPGTAPLQGFLGYIYKRLILHIMLQEVENLCYTLHTLNCHNVSSEHAIRTNREPSDKWHNSVPTYFVYSFFTFNSIYSIDWAESIKREQVVYAEGSQQGMINSLIRFCYDKSSIEHKKNIKSELLKLHDESYIHDALDSITPDISELGSVVDEETDRRGYIHKPIERFIDAFECFLKSNTPKVRDIIDITLFIYRIRCNIFHGVKMVSELDGESLYVKRELQKLKVYTSFLNELNSFCLKSIQDTISRLMPENGEEQ